MSEQPPPESGAAPQPASSAAVVPHEKAPFKVIAGMALAQFGLFVALLAPVTVTLALKLKDLLPASEAAVTNGQVLAVAALLAMVANPLIGRLSDMTTSRLGRRRPWMIAGAFGFVGALVLIGVTTSIPLIFVGWALAQVFGNMILAPLLTTIADQVPEQQRGSVAANVGIMQNLGILAAAYVGVLFAGNSFLMLVVPAVFAAICVLIYCALLPDIVIDEVPVRLSAAEFAKSFWVNPRKYPDFGWVWISRFFVVLAVFLFVVFRVFFLNEQVGIKDDLELGKILFNGVLINTVLLVLFAKIGGVLSDKTGNRKGFVIVATLIYGIATGLLAVTHTVPMFYLVEALMGIGYGVYIAVDTALVVDVLPNPEDSAKDLGVMNIANALPQSLAGLIGGVLVGIGAANTNNYQALFIGGFVFAALGALFITRVRSTAKRHADQMIIAAH